MNTLYEAPRVSVSSFSFSETIADIDDNGVILSADNGSIIPVPTAKT